MIMLTSNDAGTEFDVIDTRCHECDATEGHLHEIGCQQEKCPTCSKPICNCICYFHFKTGNTTCPFCNNTIDHCACCFDVIFDHMEKVHEKIIASLMNIHPLDHVDRARNEYLTFLDHVWTSDVDYVNFLNERGRSPHVFEPVLCFRCGKVNPRMFKVPDDEWAMTIPRHLRSRAACKDCYDTIRHARGLPPSETAEWIF